MVAVVGVGNERIMALDKPLEIDDHVRRLIAARGLTEAHIRYCREHDTDGYTAGDTITWACTIPLGCKMKVKAIEKEHTILVIHAFTYGK